MIGKLIASSPNDTEAKFGCILIVRSDLSDLVAHKLIADSLARRFGENEIVVPSLASRAEDLRAMILDKTARVGMSLRGEPSSVDHAVLEVLLNYSWPGNETELAACLQLLTQQSSGALIHLDDLERIGFPGLFVPDASSSTDSPPVTRRPPSRRLLHRQR
jgi:transcriptional activator for dhaKLM operon